MVARSPARSALRPRCAAPDASSIPLPPIDVHRYGGTQRSNASTSLTPSSARATRGSPRPGHLDGADSIPLGSRWLPSRARAGQIASLASPLTGALRHAPLHLIVPCGPSARPVAGKRILGLLLARSGYLGQVAVRLRPPILFSGGGFLGPPILRWSTPCRDGPGGPTRCRSRLFGPTCSVVRTWSLRSHRADRPPLRQGGTPVSERRSSSARSIDRPPAYPSWGCAGIRFP